jgi:hypothetical protein
VQSVPTSLQSGTSVQWPVPSQYKPEPVQQSFEFWQGPVFGWQVAQ